MRARPHLNWPSWRFLPRALRIALLAAIFAGLIAGSLLPQMVLGPQHGFPKGSDFGVHMAVYAGVTILTVLVAGRPLASAPAIFALSLLLEWAQGLVPERTASGADVLANAIGISAGLCALAILALRRRASPAGRAMRAGHDPAGSGAVNRNRHGSRNLSS